MESGNRSPDTGRTRRLSLCLIVRGQRRGLCFHQDQKGRRLQHCEVIHFEAFADALQRGKISKTARREVEIRRSTNTGSVGERVAIGT